MAKHDDDPDLHIPITDEMVSAGVRVCGSWLGEGDYKPMVQELLKVSLSFRALSIAAERRRAR